MSPTPSSRKPGGARSNTNALRHGLYSFKSRLENPSAAEGADQDALVQLEVKLLRGAMHKVIEMSSQPGGPNGIIVLREIQIYREAKLAASSEPDS